MIHGRLHKKFGDFRIYLYKANALFLCLVFKIKPSDTTNIHNNWSIQIHNMYFYANDDIANIFNSTTFLPLRI